MPAGAADARIAGHLAAAGDDDEAAGAFAAAAMTELRAPGRLPAEHLTIVRRDLTPSGQSRGPRKETLMAVDGQKAAEAAHLRHEVRP
jgi:hypothetical protein